MEIEENLTLVDGILKMGLYMYYVFSLAPMLLYCTLCCLAADIVQVMIDRIQLESSLVDRQLWKWKRDYDLVYDFVAEIDHFFRVILVVYTAYFLEDMVTFTFSSLATFRDDSIKLVAIDMTFDATWELFTMTLVIFLSNRIKQKVRIV